MLGTQPDRGGGVDTTTVICRVRKTGFARAIRETGVSRYTKKEGEGHRDPRLPAFQPFFGSSLLIATRCRSLTGFAARNRTILDRAGHVAAFLGSRGAGCRRSAGLAAGICKRKCDACGKQNSGAKRQCFIFHDMNFSLSC